jgi:photosystem II stability/assembly factor-like uncharacterized protein
MKQLRTILYCLSLLFSCCWLAFAQGRAYTVQIASKPTEAEARTEAARLSVAGFAAHWVKAEVSGMGVRYRVRFGRFTNQAEAKARAELALKRKVIEEFIVTFYDTPTEEAVVANAPKTATPPPTAEKKKVPDNLALNKSQPVEEKLAAEKSASPNKKTEVAPTNPPPPVSKATNKEAGGETKKETGKEDARASKTNSNKAKSTPATNEVAKANPTESKPSVTPAPPSQPKVEEKAPAKTETKTTEAGNNADKSNVATNLPAETVELEPAPTTKTTKPDKVASAPRIAQPPIADALGELDINNSNWKIVRRSNATDKNLRTIYFVDSMTGWAAGDAGAVYRTNDGGKTWKPLLSGAVANINQIQFVDWNNGWMLGEMARKDDGEPETVVLSTTNGGRSWKKQPLPNVLGIFFTDALHGWAVGKNATMLRTEDGGNEWKAVPDLEKLIGLPVESSNYNFGFRDIFFLDSQNGWLIGNFYGRAKSHIGGLFVTNDGGATWKRVAVTVQTQYSSGRFTPGVLHSVRFTDLNTGSLTGEMMDGEGRFFFALHTRDGAKNWEQYRTPSRATHSTQFLGPATGWTAAAAQREGGADAVAYDSTLLRTDNGGASWHTDFVARGSRIRGVFFLSPSKGWAVGDRGMILRYEEKSKAN